MHRIPIPGPKKETLLVMRLAATSPKVTLPLLLCLALAGCGGDDASKPPPPHLAGFIGGVAADEPRAALAARQILATGGNAADAAVALGFMLSATLPSRASLGAGGACLAYQPGESSPNKGVPEAILFTPVASATAGGDRPAAVPMLARGLYLLGARYGSKPFEELVAPAEQVARFGQPVSRALARDLAAVATPLLADPAAHAVFAGPDGAVLPEGGSLIQSDLSGTLARIRVAGVGDFYQGGYAHKIAEQATAAGSPMSPEDLRGALPRLRVPLIEPAGNDRVAFLPPPADGGLAAAAGFVALSGDPQAAQNGAAAGLAAVAAWRAQGGDPAALVKNPASGAALPALGASTSFVTLDRRGGAVACALTMDNLFGTGRIAPGTGIVLAASPAAKPLPLLAAALAWNQNLHAFRAVVAGSGQNAAGLAVAAGMANALANASAPVPDPGRANTIECGRYLPGNSDTCRWATDARGNGLALGGN